MEDALCTFDVRTQSLFTFNSIVAENGNDIATLEFKRMSEKSGVITIGDRVLRVERTAKSNPVWELFDGEEKVTEISKPSALRNEFVFTDDGVEHVMRSKHKLSMSCVIMCGEDEVALIPSPKFFARSTQVYFQKELSLENCLLCIWTFILMFRRSTSGAAGANAGAM